MTGVVTYLKKKISSNVSITKNGPSITIENAKWDLQLSKKFIINNSTYDDLFTLFT